MPRYLVETQATGALQHDRAAQLVAQRFPEIAVEHHYTAHDDVSTRELLACRAPSRTHVERWAEAARLPLRSVEEVDSTSNTSAGDINDPHRTRVTRPKEQAS